MTFKTGARIRETSVTTGTGTYTLDGAPAGFQAFSVLGANNLCPYFATDGTSWEEGIGTVLTGPARLARTHVLASSNAGAAVNWGAGTRTLRCGPIGALATPRKVTKDVAGSGTTVLTQDEQRNQVIELTGALSGARTVELDASVWPLIVHNNTSGAFALTVKVTGQTGVVVSRGRRAVLYCDGADVRQAEDGSISSPAQITANQNDYDPGGASVLRLSADARRSLTGLSGGVERRDITIHNVGTQPILFKHEDAASAAANRFAFGHTLSGGHSLKIQYDATSSRWRCTFKQDPAGTIKHFGGSTVPEGQLALDGSNRSRTTYAALFNEWGTTWGVGDGSTTFGTPDSRRRVEVGAGGTGTGTLGNAVGNTGGAETHTLTQAETPVKDHAHTASGSVPAGAAGETTGRAGGWDGVTGHSALSVSVSVNAAGDATASAHNVMQPAYVVTKTVVF